MTRTAYDVVRDGDLTGRTCVVTGATAGLGLESARALAGAGASVVLAGRSADALRRARASIEERVPDARLRGLRLDLASLRSVRRAAAELRDDLDRVDVLMNNAGVMFTPFGRTEDGFETQVGVNHLGHFELTRRLLPLLRASGSARVVTLSSGGHRMGDVDLADLNWEHRPYDKFAAYGAAKTANLLHMTALHARHHGDGIRAVAVNPGPVATDLSRHMAREDFSRLRRVVAERSAARGHADADGRLEFTTPEVGAATQVWAAAAPELDAAGGSYLEDCALSEDVEPSAVDPTRAELLWEISERCCGDGQASSNPA
ncbi:SDR family NAD(P)-dependent oxidoreductase [Nocardioides sp. YIM 152315]|uniref:SDR family NAD(P)-dependent oxidoreductase n=1 Tax=Nocardioides sp. YIM 152315 TaxID=3031760 RepID=UPI0023DC9DE3|nr:SDR family NAD(P)-dependent oxidoreductase [Nocardioides sp. YIM 152315]MDF1604705.1 SDR family NAD(P)-dependent oxidoreductase [Nocardioides sp. YIM 152315]